MVDQVVFISICTRQKNEGGSPGYHPELAIESKIDPELRSRLLGIRTAIQNRLREEIEFDGIAIEEENDNLIPAMDFGREDSGDALYLPAIDRYNGRFFNNRTGLGVRGDDGLTGKERLRRNGHPLLILSGLYGIVEADEPIQNYSCPIDHKSIDVQKIWRSNGVISQAIVEYISTLKQTQGIEVRRIIDLTAMKIYRDLVDWSAIHHQTRAEVLHCFHRKLAGDTALEAFATFFRDYLLMLSTEELLALEPDRRISFGKEHFVLTAKTDPPEGWARESIGTIATDPTHLEVVFRLYEEALTELERAVKALSSGEIRVMETAIDTGGSKIGKAFENALKIYLHVPEHEYVRWDRLVQNTMDQAKEVFTRDDVLRFNYIREQRNIAAHRYFSRFWELGMEVQTVHWLLVTLLKVRPDAITDPLLVLQRSNRNHP